MTVPVPSKDTTAGRRRDAAASRRWLALVVLAGSQLLIVLDATIVNVALTAIEQDLRLGATGLHWVITAYVLAFGGLLLLGGRLADRYGRRRMFIVGAATFAVGSALGGAATTASLLIIGRALQGTAAAILAPASLSLLMVVFPPGPHRNRALAIWGGVSASGMTIGLMAGGVLTQALSWHWIFWINVPVAAAAIALAPAALPAGRTPLREPFDAAGALLATGGLVALGYGLVDAAESGLTQLRTLSMLAIAAALLLAFARLQFVRAYALLPTHLFTDQTIVGANLVALILGAVVYSLFYVLSVYLGGMLGYGPIRIGLSFLPMTIAIALAASGASRALRHRGTRPLLVTSAVLLALALATLTRITPEGNYPGVVLPALLLAGAGLGLSFVALTTAAVGSAPTSDSGAAAAVFNAAQQVGGALGLVVLTVVATARTRSLTRADAVPADQAIIAGWSLGLLGAAVLVVLGLAIILTMIRPGGRS